ncbi:hypothetical protein XM48_12260 [Leucobacter sp. Ag1]|nr:hypothetical protein XM48_12260 [Leucobacter sp. Ag1]
MHGSQRRDRVKLDDTHRRMIDLLRQDGRLSVNALAEQLGISRSNAYQRFERLIQAGIITGFRADIDPRAVGLGISALVFVTLEQARWTEFREALAEVEELEYFAVTTGQHDAMLLVRAADVAGIHGLVSLRLAQWPSIKSTETVFLMDEASTLAALPTAPAQASAASEEFDGQVAGMTRFIRARHGGAQE